MVMHPSVCSPVPQPLRNPDRGQNTYSAGTVIKLKTVKGREKDRRDIELIHASARLLSRTCRGVQSADVWSNVGG